MVKILTFLKSKWKYVLAVILIIGSFVFGYTRQPKVVKQVVTQTVVDTTLQQKYLDVVKQLNKEVAKNVNTKVITIYGDNGKVKSVESDTTDLTKITTASVTTTTVTVTTASKTVETTKTITTYSQTALGLGLTANLVQDITPDIYMRVDGYTFDVGYAIIRKEFIIGVAVDIIKW